MPADNGRSYVLDRLKSKRTTIEEFNFDRLQAPPLSMFLSPYDIAELRSIATSVSLSGKAEERYRRIDEVLKRKGLVKFGAGTNRVVYRHPEFNDILFKIASDAVGMGDNPAEYRNQFILKPFVAKTFEISPCGTVALVERVKPIISREEFLSIADDVFELLNTWIIGKYIVADIGSRYFMNFSVRRNFGCVICDYPYVYELDGNKLFCRKPDPNSITGTCDGEIDYDDGYNKLVCTKCGAIYKAKELAKNIEKNVIHIGKEDIKMGVTIKRGGAVVSSTNNGVVSKSDEEVSKVTIVKAAPSRPVTEKTVNGVSVGKRQQEKEVKEVETEKTAKTNVEDSKIESKEVKVEDKKIISPISFDENLKNNNYEADKSTPVYDIEKATANILDNISKIKIDDIKIDAIDGILNKLSKSDVDKLSIFKLLIKVAVGVFDSTDDLAEEALKDENLISFITKNYELISEVDDSGDSIEVNSFLGAEFEFDKKPEDRIKIAEANFKFEKTKVENAEKQEAVNSVSTASDSNSYEGITWYSGKMMNSKELIPSMNENVEMMVVVDDDGNILTDKTNYIVAVDVIDDQYISDTTMVSKVWLDNMIAENEKINPEPEKVDLIPKKPKESTETVEKEAPVGALPPQETTEEKMEEFLEENSEE